MKNRFSGVYAALLTPFEKDGNVSELKLRALLRFLLKKGINGFYVCGGTGEGMLMGPEERKQVAEIAREEIGGRAGMLVHVGGALNTRNSVHLARHAEKLGVDGVSSIPPIYYPYKFSEIFDYYRMIAESTGLPFFIYYIPGTTGVVLANEQIAKLQVVKNIRGLKYTHPDLYILQDLLLRTKGKWLAFSGPDELFLPALTMGVAGSIGSTQNVLPEIFVGIYRNFQAGKLAEAMRLQRRVTAAVTLMKKYGGTTAWKTALHFRGIDAGLARRPLRPELPRPERKEFARAWKSAFPDFSEDL